MPDNELLESAVQLFKDIYTFTETWPTAKIENFSQVMDIRRTAMTLPNHITESLNRLHDDDSGHFWEESQNTLAELENSLLAARDRQDLATEKFDSLLARIDKIKIMLRDIKSRA